MWKLLEIFHPELTNDILNKDFTPSETEENQDFLREQGLGVLLGVYFFLKTHSDARLLISGHTDRSGKDAYNQQLSEARARTVQALLEANQQDFVVACKDFHVPEDDAIILAYTARELNWPCQPKSATKATKAEIECFQHMYNEAFAQSIAEDGVVGKQTLGAYFDVYQEILQRLAGSATNLQELRSHLQFLDPTHPYLACGENFPLENPQQDGFRSQQNRRVELLFFDVNEGPDLADEQLAMELIYQKKRFKLIHIDRDALFANPNVLQGDVITELVPDDEPEVIRNREPLVTQMEVHEEEQNGDLWAFLEPFDEVLPRDEGIPNNFGTDTFFA